MSVEKKSTSITISPAAITAIFVILKLTRSIHWSWFWVLSPVWIAVGLWFVALAFIFLLAVLQSINGRRW